MTYGIYVHIPFCNQKCHYCDFLSIASSGEKLREDYVDELLQEIALAKRVGLFAGPPATIFFGGGTPTVLEDEALVRILGALQDSFGLPATGEATIEANPGTVDGAKLERLRQGGFTRLSFGVQAYQEELLRRLGRIHCWQEVVEGVRGARAAGFASINMDLIYGLPGQTVSDWQETLEQALALEPDHLSLYGLKVEEGTPFARWEEEDRLELPAEEDHTAMYEEAIRRLAVEGFEHYEISNWARPGHQCCHNRIYWQNGDYLGLGLGASSHRQGRRWRNLEGFSLYAEMVKGHRLPVAEEETLTLVERQGEDLFLRHRLLRDGFAWDVWESRWGQPIPVKLLTMRQQLVERGLLTLEGSTTRLSDQGILLSNEVFARFLAALEE